MPWTRETAFVQVSSLALAGLPGPSWAGDEGRRDSVAARPGGFPGILAFLNDFAVPALLADPEIAPFFAAGRLTESPPDIEPCLAMLLDHDLGGSSPHSGVVLASGHPCRSSMSNIHRGFRIPDWIGSSPSWVSRPNEPVSRRTISPPWSRSWSGIEAACATSRPPHPLPLAPVLA